MRTMLKQGVKGNLYGINLDNDDAQGASLTAEKIIRAMQQDLLARGRIEEAWAREEFPLYQLAPVFYREYIEPRAPKAEDIERAWAGVF